MKPTPTIPPELRTRAALAIARQIRRRGLPAYAIIGSGQFACHATTLTIVKRSLSGLHAAGWTDLRVEAMP